MEIGTLVKVDPYESVKGKIIRYLDDDYYRIKIIEDNYNELGRIQFLFCHKSRLTNINKKTFKIIKEYDTIEESSESNNKCSNKKT